MKLPRLLPLRRARAKPSRAAAETEALALARAQALEQMLVRRHAPSEGVPGTQQAEVAQASAPERAASAGVEALAQSEASLAQATDPMAAAQTAATEAEAETGEGMDPDLLNIFRDAKHEAEEGSLASEVEDVPIQDLLADVWSIGQRLGVKPPSRPQEPARLTFTVPEPEPAGVPEEKVPQDAELPKVVQIPPAAITSGKDPIDALGMRPDAPAGEPKEADDSDVEELLVSAQQDLQAEERDDPSGAPAPEVGQQQTLASSDTAGRRYLLHMLFYVLALGLAASVGVRGATTGAFAGDYGSFSTPAVLAYLQPPVVPHTLETAPGTPSLVPPPSPTPAPSQTPTPSPTPALSYSPMPPKIGGPAYFLYTVESGDSLSTIAASNDICPDHILWNNPGRKEEDPLFVGQKLLLPGVKGIVHRVKGGDTLASIAAMYGTRPDKIVAVTNNHLAPGQEPVPGSRILVPDGIPPSALLRDELAQDMTHIPSSWGYVWPFFGPITTYYGEERPGYTHLAIDIGGLGSYGAPVGAAAAGTVLEAVHGDAALGNYVTLHHQDGSRTMYAHLSEVYVTPGQAVTRAEPVGALGCTGHATGTHLHFELWINGRPVDPLDYLP